jgi:hypothetical protein
MATQVRNKLPGPRPRLQQGRGRLTVPAGVLYQIADTSHASICYFNAFSQSLNVIFFGYQIGDREGKTVGMPIPVSRLNGCSKLETSSSYQLYEPFTRRGFEPP